MKLVSAAKLKKAQDAIINIAVYDEKLHDIVQNLGLSELEENSLFFQEAEEINNVLIVVVGTNRGLCGPFNSNISKYGIIHALDNYGFQLKSGNVEFLPIGSHVEKQLRMRNLDIFEEANALVNNSNLDLSTEFASKLISLFKENRFQKIDIVYNKFKNAALQILSVEQYLPVPKPNKTEEQSIRPFYIFEPSQKEIVNEIIPKALHMRMHRIILDSTASEHGARMTSMHQATDNASKLIDTLRKSYNNARQSAITNEIIEISAGAEALNGHS
jgi:F-type H+-transporting ATPase subunit gamma